MLSECSGGVGIVCSKPVFTSRNLENKSKNIVCEAPLLQNNSVNNNLENNHKLDIIA